MAELLEGALMVDDRPFNGKREFISGAFTFH